MGIESGIPSPGIERKPVDLEEEVRKIPENLKNAWIKFKEWLKQRFSLESAPQEISELQTTLAEGNFNGASLERNEIPQELLSSGYFFEEPLPEGSRILRETGEGLEVHTISNQDIEDQRLINSYREYIGEENINWEDILEGMKEQYETYTGDLLLLLQDKIKEVDQRISELEGKESRNENEEKELEQLRQVKKRLENLSNRFATSIKETKEDLKDPESVRREITDRAIFFAIEKDHYFESHRDSIIDSISQSLPQEIPENSPLKPLKELIDEYNKTKEQFEQAQDEAQKKDLSAQLVNLYQQIRETYYRLEESETKENIRKALITHWEQSSELEVLQNQFPNRSIDQLSAEEQARVKEEAYKLREIQYLDAQEQFYSWKQAEIKVFKEASEELGKLEDLTPEKVDEILRKHIDGGTSEEEFGSNKGIVDNARNIYKARELRREGKDRVYIKSEKSKTPEAPPEQIDQKKLEELEKKYISALEKYLLGRKDRRRLWSGINESDLSRFREELLDAQIDLIRYYMNARARGLENQYTDLSPRERNEKIKENLIEIGIQKYLDTLNKYFEVERQLEGDNTPSKFQSFWRSKAGTLIRLIGGAGLTTAGFFTGLAPLSGIGAAMAVDSLGWAMAKYFGRNKERSQQAIEKMSYEEILHLIASHNTLAREEMIDLSKELDKYEHKNTFEELMKKRIEILRKKIEADLSQKSFAIDLSQIFDQNELDEWNNLINLRIQGAFTQEQQQRYNELYKKFLEGLLKQNIPMIIDEIIIKNLRGDMSNFLLTAEEADIRSRRYRIGRKFASIIAGLGASILSLPSPPSIPGGGKMLGFLDIDKDGVPHLVIEHLGKHYWWDGEKWRILLTNPNTSVLTIKVKEGFLRSIYPFIFEALKGLGRS